MTKRDWIKLIKLGVQDLEEAVNAYEHARETYPESYDYLLNIPHHYKRESICRRIVQLRQDLLLLGKEFEK